MTLKILDAIGDDDESSRNENASNNVTIVVAPESFNASFAERDILCAFCVFYCIYARNAAARVCRRPLSSFISAFFSLFFVNAFFCPLLEPQTPLPSTLCATHTHILSFRENHSGEEDEHFFDRSNLRFFCVLRLVKRYYKREKRIVIARSSFPIL